MRYPVRPHVTAMLCAAIALMGVPSLCAPASAQVPSSADPSRTLAAPSGSKKPDFQGPEADVARPPATLPANAPEGADQAFFTLKSIRLEGMTAYPEKKLARVYAADIGRSISVARLFEILNAVQKRYLDDGYTLTRVLLPTQDISGGDVVFQVIEGYAAQVLIDGVDAENPLLVDVAARLAGMRPLNTKALERQLLILNDLPGLNVSAIMGVPEGPSRQPGAIRLILKQNPEATRAFGLSVNNHGSRYSGPYQATGTARQVGVVGAYDELAVTLAAAIPFSEMRYGGLRYTTPVFGASGTLLSVEGALGATRPGEDLRTLDVKGKSKSLKASLTYPLIRLRDATLRLNGFFEARNAETDLSGDRLYDDRLRVAGAGLTYNFADRFYGLNALEMTYSKGFDILGVRESGSVDLSRSAGQTDFRKAFASLGRLQSLPRNFEVLGMVQGQYAWDPLLASEEFGFGGGQVGRGYDPSELTGDRGVSGTLELRHNALLWDDRVALQTYGFLDAGKVWNIDPGAAGRDSAVSTGGGIRLGLPSGWSADVNASVPLTRDAEKPPKYANGQSPRFLLSLQKNF